ncbi:MAG: hypothetical protein IJ644_00695 [Oscillospiraceae bacterium]|nr:hypothetical protein [Oscillospiraceae bacterium]
MNSKTYESVQGIGKTGQELENFGTAQNQLNADILKEIRIMQLQTNMLTHHLKEAQEEIAELKEEQVKYILKLNQCKAEVDSLTHQLETKDSFQTEVEALRQEVGRLKLTARLNTNAIERLSHKEDES